MSTDMMVRSITEEDCAILRHLAQQCKPLDVHTHYTYWVLSKFFGDSSFVLCSHGETCGYITSVETKNRIFVWQIGILEEYRSYGYSRMLIEAVAQKAIQRKKNMSVSIAEDNDRSFNAFDSFCRNNSCGFVKTGKLSLNDLVDKSFSETENIYDILINEEWDKNFCQDG